MRDDTAAAAGDTPGALRQALERRRRRAASTMVDDDADHAKADGPDAKAAAADKPGAADVSGGTVAPPAGGATAPSSAIPIAPGGDPVTGGDDRALLDELRKGSRTALATIYERHKSAVMALAAGMLGHEGRDGAWDVLHDAFVGLAKAGPGLRPECNVRAYLLQSAANRARDVLARRKTRETHRERAARHPPPADPSPDPGLAAVRREQSLKLWDGLSRLPEEQRTIVAARVFGQMSFAEIAEAENIPENTAHSRYRYAIRKLRRHFGLDEDAGELIP